MCTRKRRVIRRTVQKALPDNAWLQNIQGHYSVLVLAELLNIWDLVEEILHQPEVEDLHKWRFEASGQFSTESAYEALFNGAIHFEPSKLIWSTWAPSKCNFFSGWLHTIAARQQTGSQVVAFLILRVAPSLARKMRRFNIFCVHVFTPGNSSNSCCAASLAPQTIMAGSFEWWQQAG